jgi:hypothetical protein
MLARRCITTLLLLALTASPVLAVNRQGADIPPPESGQTEAMGSPTDVLDDIQAGWTNQNAELILRHFGSNKVIISIDGSGPGGSYSKDQGYFVFKELFKSTVTRKFVFVQIRTSNDDGTASFAIAERRYQRRDDGRQIKDKVYIALHVERERDSGRWVLDEIKAIR